ncbi:3-oxoacyl [Elsinoe australis]|uniref:3-oxoacyl n=1 Tax=Elsinoe australis TaxID=40998 RepID=A0A2P7YFS2_9PEZI|nr:3-oxoacyl [Elsinoe australis]
MPSENSIHIPYRLDGKVALVTGSGRGIGAAAAIELGRCGAKVVVNHSKSAAPALQVVEEIKKLGSDAVAIQANVSQVSEIERLFDEAVQHYGRLDIACSNAWVVSFGHLEEVTEEEFDRVFTLNTRAQFFVAREAYKHLNPGGRVILMSSNTKREFAVPKHSVYSGSKAAIESFVRVMALDAGKKQITVNAVAPGGTATDMFYDVARHYIPDGEKLNMDQIKGMAAHASPLVRCGYPIDVAHVICFLASVEGGWINGKTLTIDGGAR